MKFYQVAANFPKIESVLTYKSEQSLNRGTIVSIPLGRRKTQGVVLKECYAPLDIAPEKIKAIHEEIKEAFPLDDKEIQLFEWMGNYYHYSLGKLVFDCLPKILKRPRKVEFKKGEGALEDFQLTSDQAQVLSGIQSDLGQGFSRHYIHGVTGSGKSLIFLKAMKEVLRSKKSVQFLLPEINLTPQFVRLFEQYLDVPIYSYHSGISASEKYTIWKSLKESNEPILVMGVRSSIFLPIQNLGLIVVDEEHDQSFKQEDRCAYNGRDVAMKKAQINDCLFLMGSATPSVENFYLFSRQSDGRRFYQLDKRVGEGNFPAIHTIDTSTKDSGISEYWPLSEKSIEKIRERFLAKEQVLVFINQLGFANFLQCRACSYRFVNENCGCANNLKFFKHKNILKCSHCEFYMPKPPQCPACGNMTLLNKGFGTEKVWEVLTEIFPEQIIERFDRDEVKNFKQLKLKLERFQEQKIDLLVGTQMLAKGHNFEKVNLVVILGIDSMLSFADFRAQERTYSICEQVAGRAGRYKKDSEVCIETLNADHEIFAHLSNRDMNSFYQRELKFRQYSHCPPFSKIAMIYFSSSKRERLIAAISDVAKRLREVCEQKLTHVQVHGPIPSAIEKKANQFTWAIMLKSSRVQELHLLLKTFENNYTTISNISVNLDVDPLSTL